MTLFETMAAWLLPKRRSVAGAARTEATSLSEPEALAALGADAAQRRWEAASALGQSGLHGRETIPALVHALGDPEPFVRWQAARALAAQEPGAVYSVIRLSLADADPLRRAGAAEPWVIWAVRQLRWSCDGH